MPLYPPSFQVLLCLCLRLVFQHKGISFWNRRENRIDNNGENLMKRKAFFTFRSASLKNSIQVRHKALLVRYFDALLLDDTD